MDRSELLERIGTSRAELEELVAAVPVDNRDAPLGDGWSVKQHLAHLAAWEDSLTALLRHESRPAAMGVPDDVWANREAEDSSAINAVVADRVASTPFDAVRQQFIDSHARLLAALANLSDADLQRPYSDFDPTPPRLERPIEGWIHGNTFEHYEEHIGWLRAGVV